MKLGIKKKILLVLVGSLALTSALHALLASHFTNRQNQASAFALLELDLLAWQNELHDLTLALREAAVATVGDGIVLDHLAEQTALRFSLDAVSGTEASWETARTLAYLKSVSINRLHLALRTGDFSGISVYSNGKLSHHVSTDGGGMMLRRANGEDIWVAASADEKGDLPTRAWPAWQSATPPVALTIAPVAAPDVSFDFSSPDDTAIQIAVPIEGVIEEVLTDADVRPKTRFVSELAIAGRGAPAPAARERQAPEVLATVVFRKRIGHAELEKVAARTDKLPTLFSPVGDHRQHLSALGLPPPEALARVAVPRSGGPSPVWQGIVTDEQGSYYGALRAWHFEGRPALILGLASSRAATLQNIQQTVAAILIAAGLILLLSLAAAMLLVGRLINPVVALTAAVKAIGARRPAGTDAGADATHTLEGLRPVEIHAPDEVGELTRAFNVMIGELRATLETLEQRVFDRTAELRQQTHYLHALIDTLPLMIWLKDPAGRYVTVNQANARACGRTVEEMIGKSDVELWPAEVAEDFRAQDAEVLATRHGKMLEEAQHDGKRTIWIETSVAPVLDEDGAVLGTVGAARDISERKAAEAAREAALAEAERLARLRSEFLAQMSHELRTPLNGILGYAQLLRRDRSLGEKQIEGLDVIQQSGEHLLTLINDILDLAKVEAGKLELYPGDIDLGRFLIVIADIVRVKAEEKELAFICDFAPDLPARVRVDEKRLRQVLLNLLSNAVKFTDRGQVGLTVGVSPPDRLRFEVRDTGVGIDSNEQRLVFEPFEQAGDPRQRIAGAGLGLAISRQFVRLMGGDIGVDSHVGEGSTFWFEIEVPVVRPAPAAAAPEGSVSGYLGPRRTVLVVDDLEENRRLVADMLGPLGFTVVEATNGREALAQARATPPDLVLMDIVMPEMDGLEATRRLRLDAALAQVPVIAISASASDGDEQDTLAAGADTFLPKPLDLGKLLAHLHAFLKLQWSYDDSPSAQAESAGDSRTPMVLPPPEEMEILYGLVLQGNMRDIVRWADRIAALGECYQPFANQLRRLAEAYQSKALLALVERYLDARPAE